MSDLSEFHGPALQLLDTCLSRRRSPARIIHRTNHYPSRLTALAIRGRLARQLRLKFSFDVFLETTAGAGGAGSWRVAMAYDVFGADPVVSHEVEDQLLQRGQLAP